MVYLISFLEGIITFISPCMLPMLPVYVSYFAGRSEKSISKTAVNALLFVAGFTLVFILMGAFAGTLGSFFQKYKTLFNIISGAVVLFFGLSYLGIFNLHVFRGMSSPVHIKEGGIFSSLLLGIVFSVGWTPCVGAYLGSALMLASRKGSMTAGVMMLLLYSLGLGVPFVMSAVLIDRLKSVFNFIKRNYHIINVFCGGLLVIMGILMMTGVMNRFLSILG